MELTVLLSGKLAQPGTGLAAQKNGSGTYALSVGEGSNVGQVVQAMGVPPAEVAMTMVNGRRCDATAKVAPGDRVVLIPPDVAALWGFVHRQALAMGVGLDH